MGLSVENRAIDLRRFTDDGQVHGEHFQILSGRTGVEQHDAVAALDASLAQRHLQRQHAHFRHKRVKDLPRPLPLAGPRKGVSASILAQNMLQ